MRISVIIPAYNRQDLIGQALGSLLRQRDATDLDIIVVDDGSTDGTSHVVQRHMEDAPCIRLVRQQNLGVAKARNAGLKSVPDASELITFLDSDDVSPAGRLTRDYEYFRADPSLDLAWWLTCKTDTIDPVRLEPAKGARCEILRTVQLAAGTYRRRLIQTVGYFNEEFRQSEDADYLFRIFESNPRRVLLDGVGVYYRQHPDSLMSRHDEVKQEFLKALLRASQRRRADPTLGTMRDLYGPRNHPGPHQRW